MPTSATSSRRPRSSRQDGDTTRQQLLDVAGQVFAERGYADATSKEICARAGANVAAVNYHFGSRDALYQAVLVEAHRQIVSVDQLAGMVGSVDDPALKLRAVIGHLVGQAGRAEAWGFRVVLRELLMPSPVAPAAIREGVLPKAKIVRKIVGEVMGLPATHVAVQRGLAFVILPCLSLVVVPKAMRGQVLPALDRDTAQLLDDLLRYVLAGLEAVARPYRAAKKK